MVSQYYNRFQSSQNYEKSLFLAGRGLQSAELNEIQDNALTKIKDLGDALLTDGDVVKGCTCVIQDGSVKIEDGSVYLRGAVRTIAGTTLSLPDDGRYRIGIFVKEKTITELEDPALRDPAVGTRNYQEAGAARLQLTFTWGVLAETAAAPAEKGDFYPVYTAEHGALIVTTPAAEADTVTVALARYDRESNGSYLVSGLTLKFQKEENDEQVFLLSEGKAHVNGHEIELPHSVRLTYPVNPDLGTVESEPHVFQPNEQGEMRITLSNPTCATLKSVDITQQKSANMTHGAYAGVTDPIPDQAILEIVQIRQGSTIYTQGTDYKLQSNSVAWMGGSEPAPGSSYEVTYRSRVKATAKDVDEAGFTISNAVPGTLVLVDYTWKMPRYDLIALDSQGQVQRIQGPAHAWNPSIPSASAGQMSLALIKQTWKKTEKPQVVSTGIQAVSMNELQTMKSMIADLYDLMAEERLKNDANASDPAVKKGIFVDPFLDDDLRDLGTKQTASIVDQCLQLPIAVDVVETGKEENPWTLPYELEPVVSQTLRTGSMKVNPYQAFDPLPANVKMVLDTDRWTETITNWTSTTTSKFSTTSSSVVPQNARATGTLLSSTETEAEYLRPLTQRFIVEGFKPGEALSVTFDGLVVDPQPLSE